MIDKFGTVIYMKNLKLLERFEAAGHIYEAYQLPDDKVIIVENKGGVIIVKRKYYERYKSHVMQDKRV